MVKTRRKGSFSFNSPEFFQVYLPDYSSHHLSIPPDFIKNFSGHLPNKFILRDLTRKSWHAKVEKVERKVLINSGWQDFVNDHSLELGDFLVFSYNGDSLFDVRIFGKDGCKKEETLANMESIPQVKQEELTEDEPTHGCKRKHSEIGIKRTEKSGGFTINSPEFFKVYLPDLSSHRLRIPPAFIKNFNGNIPNKVILRDLTRKSWHAEVEKVERNVFINNGWQDFASDHSLGFGDFLVFIYNGDSLFDVRIFGTAGCKKEELTEDEQTRSVLTRVCKQEHSEIGIKIIEKSGGSSGERRYKSRRTAVLNLKKRKACIAAENIAPKDLHFVASITRSNRHGQYIPSSLLKSNGIKLKPDVTLRDKNGKSWPVKINSWKDGRLFMCGGLGGWLNFRETNKLRLGDKCVFEFVLGSGRICKEIQVQILHAGAKTQAC